MLKMLPSGLREVHFEFTPRTRKSEKRGDKQQQQHVQVARESDGRSSKERPEVGENVHFTDDVWYCHSTTPRRRERVPERLVRVLRTPERS